MALFEYMRRTQRILRDQRVQIINPSDLIAFINEARGQIAGEAECILRLALFRSPRRPRSIHSPPSHFLPG